MVATIISGAFSALLALIFDLDSLVEMMSIGTLLAYTIVSLCVVILRYQPESIGLTKESSQQDESSPLLGGSGVQQTTQWTAQLALYGISAGTIASAGLSAVIIFGSHALLQAKWWAVIILVLMGLLQIGSILLLLWLPQNKVPLAFKVPYVPILPQLSVFINLFLILKLSYLTWLRFAVWMVIGMSIYLFYGIRHSVEGEIQNNGNRNRDHTMH